MGMFAGVQIFFNQPRQANKQSCIVFGLVYMLLKLLWPPLLVEMAISTLDVDPHWWPYIFVLKPN